VQQHELSGLWREDDPGLGDDSLNRKR